jgi:hypothetical protein
MRTFAAVAALTIALSGFSVAPVYAQVTEREAVIAACAGPGADTGACEAALAAFVAVVRTLPAAQRDALLADVVITLANSSSPVTAALVADAIEVVAAEFTDPERAASALEIAAVVETGGDLDPVTAAALASPT